MRRQIKENPMGRGFMGKRFMGQRATPFSSLELPSAAPDEPLSQGANRPEIEQAQSGGLGPPSLRRLDVIGRSRRQSSFVFAALVSASLLCGATLPASANPTMTPEGRRFVARAVTTTACCGVLNACDGRLKSEDASESTPTPPGLTVSEEGRRFVARVGDMPCSTCSGARVERSLETWILIEPRPVVPRRHFK